MKGLKFISTGRAIPEKVVTNDDMSRIVDTSDEWIRTRTGIAQRYFSDGETAVDLAVGAARQAMERANVRPEEIGVCVVATCTPDHSAPSDACLVQAVLLIRADPAMLDMPAKLLYPRLARLTGLSAGGVDRAIRTAIQVCCRHTHPQRPGDELPTVRQFLAALAEGSGGSL